MYSVRRQMTGSSKLRYPVVIPWAWVLGSRPLLPALCSYCTRYMYVMMEWIAA